MDALLEEGSVLATVHRLSELDRCRKQLQPSIRLAVSAAHSTAALEGAAAALTTAVKAVLCL